MEEGFKKTRPEKTKDLAEWMDFVEVVFKYYKTW